MLLAQSEAAQLAVESLPKDTRTQQFIASNGQVMIALVNPNEVTPQLDPRWSAPSAVISRCRCAICGKEDQADQPLHICWYEDPKDGKKCGKRFCYNKHKQCGSRVAYNIKPPTRSGLKDFPDCLWCKTHESIILPVHKYKHKIGIREGWYYWDPTEAHSRAMRIDGAEHKMIGAGWRMNRASQGFKNYRASTLNASVTIYKEESLVWANGHHIAEAEEFARIDSEQYVIFMKATHKPYRFVPHPRVVADNWIQFPFGRENLLWKIHRDRISHEGCINFVNNPDEEEPMIREQVEDEEEGARDFPANVEVYPMMDDGEEGGSTSRTPR
eukprot:4418094-Amphidinium_carterae.1